MTAKGGSGSTGSSSSRDRTTTAAASTPSSSSADAEKRVTEEEHTHTPVTRELLKNKTTPGSLRRLADILECDHLSACSCCGGGMLLDVFPAGLPHEVGRLRRTG